MEYQQEDLVEIDLREYLHIIWYRKWIIATVVIAAIVLSYFVSVNMTKIYQSSVMVMVKEDSGMDNLFSEQLSLGIKQGNKTDTYIEVIKSRRILNKVIEDLQLTDSEGDSLIKASDLRARISISGGSNDLITLTVNYSDPKLAKEIASGIIDVFKAQNREINTIELQGAEDFVIKQLATTEAKLADLEDRLLEYKEEYEAAFPQEQGKAILERLTAVETAKAKAEVSLEQNQASLKGIEAKLNRVDKEVISTKVISDNPLVQGYRQQLSELEIELSSLKELYTEEYPQLIQLEHKREEIKDRLAVTVAEVVNSKTKIINPIYSSLKQKLITLQTNLIALQSQLTTYEEQIEKIEHDLNILPEKELILARLTRETKITEEVYLMLQQKKEELQIQKAMKTSDIVVIDEAISKEHPIKPNVKLNLIIAAMLGVFISVGIIFFLEFLDNTVKGEAEVEGITGIPVLGSTPDLNQIDHSRGYGRDDYNV